MTNIGRTRSSFSRNRLTKTVSLLALPALVSGLAGDSPTPKALAPAPSVIVNRAKPCPPISWAPSTPALPTTRQELLAYERTLIRPKLNGLPTALPDLVNFLRLAESKGQLTWLSHDQQAADLIQREVEAVNAGEDLHLLFGIFHLINGQVGFINKLLDRLVGVTHLVQEYKGLGDGGFDLQSHFDHYLVTGDPRYQLQMTDTGVKGDEIDQQELADMNSALELGKSQCLNVVFADLSLQEQQTIEEELIFRSREIFAVKRVEQRLSPGGGNIAVWVYGASHAEKEGLPTDLQAAFPGSKAISIIMNGGTYIPTLLFDQALNELGWLEKPFILKLVAYREGNYIIHLPIKGQSTKEKIEGVGLPLLDRKRQLIQQ
ncbi:MAG: hypothetical protein WCW67_03575 [Candidatus Margulisiibacteriota bacterium]